MARQLDLELTLVSTDTTNTTNFIKFIADVSASYGEILRAQYICNNTNITLELGNFSTINYLIVQNRDTSAYVTVEYTSTNGGGSRLVRVPASSFCVLPDVSINTVNLNSSSATAIAEVIAVGD